WSSDVCSSDLLAVLVAELLDRDDALRLQAGIDDDHVGTHVDDGTGDDRTGLELGDVGLALFEQFCEGFGCSWSHVGLCRRARDCACRGVGWIARVFRGLSVAREPAGHRPAATDW